MCPKFAIELVRVEVPEAAAILEQEDVCTKLVSVVVSVSRVSEFLYGDVLYYLLII